MEDELDFEFYYKRLAEFDSLLSITKSKTLQDVLRLARTNTEASLEKFAKLQKMTLVILTAKKITTEKQIEQYTLEIKRAATDFDAGKFSSVAEYSSVIDGFWTLGKRFKSMYELALKVYSLAVKQFQQVLLELIFKPNNKSFHYESVIDGLHYIAGKIFPGLDEISSIRKIVPNVRKRDFTKTGDKLLLYIEQYLDVLEKWDDLADAYIGILEH